MAVKLRLQRYGSKKKPFYFIVVADSRTPRNGKFIEKLGTYNPLTIPAAISVDIDSAIAWLNKGAQPTHTVNRIFSFKGVLYKKHLLRGVSMNLFDEVAVEGKFKKWQEEHDILVAKRQEKHKKQKEEVIAKAWQKSSEIQKSKTQAKEEEQKEEEQKEASANSEADTKVEPAKTQEVKAEENTAPSKEEKTPD